MILPRPLLESWLLEGDAANLAPWRAALLRRALAHDEALRCLAAELAEFTQSEEPKGPDLRPKLQALVLKEGEPSWLEPLFPSAWVPGTAVAALALAALVALLPRSQPRSSLPSEAVIDVPASRPVDTPRPTPTPRPDPRPDASPTRP